MHSYNIGSISDIVSATSSFLTFIIALMAYRAAPKWVHQKADDVSYSLSNQLICESYPEILKCIEKLIFPFRYLSDNKILISENDYIELVKNIERNDEVIWIIHEKISNLESDIKRLSRYGWNLNPRQKNLNNEFINEMQKFFSLYVSCSTSVSLLLWPDPKKCDNQDDYDNRLEFVIDRIYKSRNSLISESEVILNHLNNFLESALRIEDFFTRNTK